MFVVVILVGAGVGYSFYALIGALIGAGFFVAFCLAALPDARVSTSNRIFEIKPDGFHLSWVDDAGVIHQSLFFPKGEVEGLWVREEVLKILTDDAIEPIRFPSHLWATYARALAFRLFTQEEA